MNGLCNAQAVTKEIVWFVWARRLSSHFMDAFRLWTFELPVHSMESITILRTIVFTFYLIFHKILSVLATEARLPEAAHTPHASPEREIIRLNSIRFVFLGFVENRKMTNWSLAPWKV